MTTVRSSALLLQRVEDPADCGVDLPDQRGVVGADPQLLLAGELGVVDAVPGRLLLATFGRAGWRVAGVGHRLGHRVRVDPGQRLGGRVVRAVRTREPDHHRERSVPPCSRMKRRPPRRPSGPAELEGRRLTIAPLCSR